MRTISNAEVAKHNSKKDLWVILHGKVWNLTDFLADHPGGEKVILKWAGKDGTAAFDPIHPSDIMDKLLPPTSFIGIAETPSEITSTLESNSSIPSQSIPLQSIPSQTPFMDTEQLRQFYIKTKPSLSSMLNLFDFEHVAQKVLTPEAWAYYSSGSDDEITLRENHAAFHRIWWKPRILVNVTKVHLGSKMLNHPVTLPIYITATALGKLGHPDGELCLTRAAYSRGIPQMVPTLASYSLDQITQERINLGDKMTQFFQLYVNKDRKVTEAIIKQAERRGCRGLFVTVDAPQLGRREKDMRMKFSEEDDAEVQKGDDVDRSQGAARAISSFIDPGLCWDDVAWMKSITILPIMYVLPRKS
jgi:L-lactate dehydrogenase (cytochrome)